MSRTAILCLPAQSALHAEPLLRSQDFKHWEMNGVNSSWEPGEGSESVCGFLCLSCPAAFWFCSLPHSKEFSDCRRGSAKCRLRSWGQLWAVTPLKTSGYNRTLAHSPLRTAGLQSSKLLGKEKATSACVHGQSLLLERQALGDLFSETSGFSFDCWSFPWHRALGELWGDFRDQELWIPLPLDCRLHTLCVAPWILLSNKQKKTCLFKVILNHCVLSQAYFIFYGNASLLDALLTLTYY